MGRVVDALAWSLDGPSAEERLQTLLHPGAVVYDVLVGTGELAQDGLVRAPMIDGPQATATEFL
jgi:hypothetical protein